VAGDVWVVMSLNCPLSSVESGTRACRWRVCGWFSATLLLCQCAASSTNRHGEGDGAVDPSKWSHVRHVLRSTVFAAAKAPVTTVRMGVAMLGERGYSLLKGNVPLPRGMARLDTRAAPPGSEAFDALLDGAGFPARTCGRMELFVDGSRFFPAFLKAVKEARKQVDVQFFLFDNDDHAIQVADALRAKSREVPLRLLIDGLGTDMSHLKAPETPPPAGFRPPRNLVRYLERGSGVKVRCISDPFFVVDHTKLQVIDERQAFIGGMNIGREYASEWHDMMVRLEGPVVAHLQRGFDRAWEGEGWGHGWDPRKLLDRDRPVVEDFDPVKDCPPGQYPLRVLRTDALGAKRDILRATVLAIRCAKKRIWIQSPYYTADDITEELTAAAARGVDVRVIIPTRSDFEVMEANNHVTARDLMAGGVRVFQYPKMTHLKATLCDDWGLIGSANYDMLSLRLNRELNVAVTAPAAVRELARRVFLTDFRASREVKAKDLTKGGILEELLGDQL
jgi:cardiolipin synthase